MGCLGLSLLLMVTLWFLWFSVVIGCSSDSYALYHLRFEGLWTVERFPKVFPASRPKAQWSPVIGRTHNRSYKLFEVSQLMSDQLRPYVEYGDATGLAKEGQGHNHIFDAFSAAPLSDGHGETESVFFASSDRSEMSLVAKILPSPDWFVGVDSLQLCQDGEWLLSQSVDLWPLDGGTQRGYTFSSPNWRTNPAEEITQITSQYPNHTADAFYYPELSSLPPIAQVSIKLGKVLTVQEDLTSKVTGPQTLTPTAVLDRGKSRAHNTILKPPVPTVIKSGASLRAVFAMRRNMAPTTPEPTTTESTTSATSTPISSTSISSFPTSESFPSTETPARTQTSTEISDVEPINTSEAVATPVGQLWTTLTHYVTTTQRATSQTLGHLRQKWLGSEDDEDSQTELNLDAGSGWIVDSEEIDNSIPDDSLSLATNKILPGNEDTADVSYYHKECLVSEWSPWGECSKTCGYGVKVRTRKIVRWTGNIACPELRTEQLCGSMKQCNWSHFSLTFNSTKSLISSKQRRRPKLRTEDGEQAAELKERRTGRRGRPRKQPVT